MGEGETCSGSEAGSCLRLIDFVYHSTLGLRVIKKKIARRNAPSVCNQGDLRGGGGQEGEMRINLGGFVKVEVEASEYE